jgi:hypothetical protein
MRPSIANSRQRHTRIRDQNTMGRSMLGQCVTCFRAGVILRNSASRFYAEQVPHEEVGPAAATVG